MGGTGFTDIDQARQLVRSAMESVRELTDGGYWKINADDLLELAREYETLSRMVLAANVHLAGEIDTQGIAGQRSCSSTAALLAQTVLISPAEATHRVRAARHTLPRDTPTGPELPPLLPVLADALDTGRVGSEHVRTIVATMGKLPAPLPPEQRDFCEHLLVEKAAVVDPRSLDKIATAVLDAADPDGTLDETTPASKMELRFGSRNARTGLTGLTGTLDDHGVDVITRAIDALAAPRPIPGPTPGSDCTPDPRPSATRRAHALIEALERYLTAGDGPANGGEKPHVVVYVHWDQMHGEITQATRESGYAMTPAQARRYLCDAKIIPVVLGGQGEILDVGRAMRTFTRGMRRAITARDRGCVWDGCDRPATWCDIHHVNWWERDLGDTSTANGVLLCGYHHREIHRSEWQIRFDDHGHPETIPPKWTDPEQRPRRNRLHHIREMLDP
ncbi:protein of unknown function [Nakamurella panacisegetis]|uniref:DUF222 domain-containing protein n=1 Tax=Nakamurella panacisegetis TaxID=1090615 RepID=A0A1H0N3R5_9ACTN|nr:HNH endonuclease signature motif containing protein [Nakamurella panacisegetis]SDO87261.1 protein of unknown function [Nakamurella panacisegetis]